MSANPTYIASCSFGKDSMAQILIALEHNEPLDRVVFCEVMYDKLRGISGEIPEHRDFIFNVAIPRLQQMGLTVDVVRDDHDFIDYFLQRRVTGHHAGCFAGFPLGGKCQINNSCKVAPIKRYLKQFDSVIQYIGIAADEPERLKRLDGITKISLLDKYGITESDARDICQANGLLSPIYASGTRGGVLVLSKPTYQGNGTFQTEPSGIVG